MGGSHAAGRFRPQNKDGRGGFRTKTTDHGGVRGGGLVPAGCEDGRGGDKMRPAGHGGSVCSRVVLAGRTVVTEKKCGRPATGGSCVAGRGGGVRVRPGTRTAGREKNADHGRGSRGGGFCRGPPRQGDRTWLAAAWGVVTSKNEDERVQMWPTDHTLGRE